MNKERMNDVQLRIRENGIKKRRELHISTKQQQRFDLQIQAKIVRNDKKINKRCKWNFKIKISRNRIALVGTENCCYLPIVTF